MKVGINLQLWTSVWGRGDLPDRPVMHTLRNMGYNGVEVPFSGGPSTRYAAYGRMGADEGLSVALMDTWGPDADPLSDDPTQRASARDHLHRLVDCANTLGAEVLAGGFHHSRALPSAQEITEPEWARLVKSQIELADYAPMRLAVKPPGRLEISRLKSVAHGARLVRAVNRPNYTCLFDIDNLQMDEPDPLNALDATLPEVGHVHVSLNHSRTPGSGEETTLRALRKLRVADYRHWISVDTFAGVFFASSLWTGPLSHQTELALDAIRTIRQTRKH